ncbi:hypothetical protein DPMN_085136 [Dreissena polymorpha]|uniref:Uncharacterized protein n=1 Tax=Dreissena polymorpha TaxID=45954 RepID=A0A9D3YF49_DREPO|nr:hypothetical protein DPMN_085136 [Dreissena polymorpha]
MRKVQASNGVSKEEMASPWLMHTLGCKQQLKECQETASMPTTSSAWLVSSKTQSE